MRLHVVTLGCQMSAADGGELAAPLLGRGFTHEADPAKADVVILNTCTVRQHAEDKALSLIGRLRPWKEERPERLLIVAGCAAQRLGPWIQKRFPHVDLVVGAKSIEEFPKVVDEALGDRLDGVSIAAGIDPKIGWSSPVVAPLTIMRGCNYSCSYCIVPAVRGRESYRPHDVILAEAGAKADAGARELLLLGQTVNSWKEGARRFPDLLRAVAATPGVARVRFESPHPHFLDAPLIEALGGLGADHLHMPLQSGSDRILAAMRRNYTSAGFMGKIDAVRAQHPSIEVSTDIIVGYPSESDEDFIRTLELVERLKPVWSYTFKYSPREGTEAAGRPDDVPEPVKEERLARLNAICDRLTEEAMRARVGRTLEVLTEGEGYGRARDGFRVRFSGPEAGLGELVQVRIAGMTKRTLTGERA